MRVIFMGTPDFSVPILQALVDAGHEIVAVYTQPPRPAGRGKKERPSAVQSKAEALGLSVRYPTSLRKEDEQEAFEQLHADVAVVVAYGLILPQSILDAPRLGCLNIHASLLPRWRGAAPIHRAIMSGDDKTGVCIMQMEAGLDTGPVLTRHEVVIEPQETTAHLHDRLSELGATAITEALEQIEDLVPQRQPETGVTYAAKIEKSEAAIDWSRDAHDLAAHIHGLSPFPGAWFEMDGVRIKVMNVEVEAGEAPAGLVLDESLCVACGQGALRLINLQRAGKKVQDAQTFINGWPITKGTQL